MLKVTEFMSEIDKVLDAWHEAAEHANFEPFFAALHEGALYVGTDKAEVWDKSAFMSFAKPHFDAGEGWHFHVLGERQIFICDGGTTAWFFEEVYSPELGILRGSGVMVRDTTVPQGTWLIAQYVLSQPVPNALFDKFKREIDEFYTQ